MCRAAEQGGRRCNGGEFGNTRRRLQYAEAGARKALEVEDANRFVHYAEAVIRHRTHMREHGLDLPPASPIPIPHVVAAAQFIATHAHRGQFRRDGRPYIVHPEDVAHRLEKAGIPSEIVAAGWLHDVPEDTSWTVEDLRDVGLPERTVDSVAAVTHEDGEDYLAESMPRAVKTLDSAMVKDADNQNNTSDRIGPTPAQYAKSVKRHMKYLEARRMIKRRLYETAEGQAVLEAQFAALERRGTALDSSTA